MPVYLQYEAEFRVEVTGICGYLNSPKTQQKRHTFISLTLEISDEKILPVHTLYSYLVHSALPFVLMWYKLGCTLSTFSFLLPLWMMNFLLKCDKNLRFSCCWVILTT